jgi:hypothetical protein
MKFHLALPLLSLLLASISLTVVYGDALVGVKRGDWVEYSVSFTGSPPPEHDVVWARMEVTGVEEQRVNVTFISQLANGTILNVGEDLDFATGRLIDMFVIPSGLNPGDTFYAQGVGEIMIESLDVRSAVGASRTVVHAETEDTQWFWDRATGIVVEARTANVVYTLNTVAVNTGLWSRQILGVDPNVFYAIMTFFALGVIAGAIVLIARWKRRESRHERNFAFSAREHRLHYEEK